MYKATDTPQNMFQNWQYGIEINGFEAARFQRGKIPKINVNVVEFNEAGALHSTKQAGRVSFDNVTLEKGIIADGTDKATLEWLDKIIDVNTLSGGIPSDYLRDVDYIQFNRRGEEIRRWTLHGAFVASLEYSDGDGSNDDITMEMIEIACQKITSNDNAKGAVSGNKSLSGGSTSTQNPGELGEF